MSVIAFIIFCCCAIYQGKLTMDTLLLSIIHYMPYIASGSCDTRGLTQSTYIALGQHVTLICHLRTCKYPKYNFYHVTKNQTNEQSVLVYHGRHRFILNVTSSHNSGEYYCTEQCGKDNNQDEDKKCWFNIRSEKLPNFNY